MIQRYYDWIVLSFLGIVIFILYFPALTAYFISDDFSFLSYLHFYTRDLLNGQRLEQWLIGGIQGYVFFRPLANLFWVLHYVAFELDPLGYHAISVLFHLLASYVVFLLSYLLTHNRITASVSALLFAAMPVHAEAVSWVAAMYDPLGGLFFFLGFVFFILCLRQGRRRWYLIAFLAFVAAMCSKEIALTFPVVVALYDVMFDGLMPLRIMERIKRHAPFWIVVGVRLIAFGHGYTGLQLTEMDWWSWVDNLLLRASNPLMPEINIEMRTILLVGLALGLWGYRSRPAIVFGALWVPIAFVPAVVGEISDRSFYIPSFGLSLVLASVLTRPIAHPGKWLTTIASAALLLLMALYGKALVSTNQAIRHAGEVAEAIPQQVIMLHPTMSPDDRMIFVGLPDRVPEGPLVYLTGFPGPLHIHYGSRDIQTLKLAKFPILFDKLDNTFFFEVDHRRVTERTDLVELLKQRARCENYSAPAVVWSFSESALAWEPWNQLSDWAIREGVLTMRSDGNDPILASPPIDFPTIAIGEIQITMRVRAAQSALHGELYWLASGQQDFFPALKLDLTVQADDEWHTYRVDIAKSGMLAIGDRIMRLRLDPVDTPAEIAIQSIAVFTHCSSLQGEHCICAPR